MATDEPIPDLDGVLRAHARLESQRRAEGGVPLPQRIIAALDKVDWKPHLFLLDFRRAASGVEVEQDGLFARAQSRADGALCLDLRCVGGSSTGQVFRYDLLDDIGAPVFTGYVGLQPANGATQLTLPAAVLASVAPDELVCAVAVYGCDLSPGVHAAVRELVADRDRPKAVRDAAEAALSAFEPVSAPVAPGPQNRRDRTTVRRALTILAVVALIVLAIVALVVLLKPVPPRPEPVPEPVGSGVEIGVPPAPAAPGVTAGFTGSPDRPDNLAGAEPLPPYPRVPFAGWYLIDGLFVDLVFKCPKAGRYTLVVYRPGQDVFVSAARTVKAEEVRTESTASAPKAGERVIVFALLTEGGADWLAEVRGGKVPPEQFVAWVRQKTGGERAEIVRLDLLGVPSNN